MYNLPKSIKVGDNEFHIREDGDYRVVLDCFNALNDTELSERERVISCLIILLKEFNCFEDIAFLPQEFVDELMKEVSKFFNCGQDNIGMQTNHKLIDWDRDSQMIASAINNVAHTEIRSVPYCHWWTFMGYYLSIGESVFSTVVNIRNKIAKGKKLEKHEQQFRKDNPHYFAIDMRTTSQKSDDEWIRENFYTKK